MNPQLLAAMLSGQGNSGGGGGGDNPLSQLFGNNMGAMPLLFMLAGMGIPQLSKSIGSIVNNFMDMQSAKQDSQGENPGALPQPAESDMGPPPMAGGPAPTPPGMPGGLPPQLAALAQMIAQRRMAQAAQGAPPPMMPPGM